MGIVQEPIAVQAATGGPPIVVVGAGPAGVRVVQELYRRDPSVSVLLYGEERWQPYNRVRLSSFLSGELGWEGLVGDLGLPDSPRLITRYGCRVESIDREARVVRDSQGIEQPYSSLVLALGSRPHVPDIPGIGLAGIYTFRDMDDAQRLLARRVRSRRTVVLGGGLLGLEAARAMRRHHTAVTVVEHADRLMGRQLDLGASARLRKHVEGLGITVRVGEAVKRVIGESAVSGVLLRSGEILPCDTVIVATGIRANVELARAAGLAVGSGIRVDDGMRTEDPGIYAVGECVEHRGRVYGLVAPGLEQAAVAAHAIGGGSARYAGSVAATRLKVLDLPVFSIGETGAAERPDFVRHAWQEGERYRCLLVHRWRLVGAVATGPWDEMGRVQEAVTRGRVVLPWQLWRFARGGELWPAQDAGSVVNWPAAATVCNCTGVTRGRLSEAVAAGCDSAQALASCTGASTVCGSCRPLLAELAGAPATAEAVRAHATVTAAAALTAALALLAVLAPAIPYPDTVQVPWRWDVLWRDSLWKQVSGFTVLGLAVIGLALSLRKRVRRVSAGHFDLWRLAHVLAGVGAALALAVHTGGRLGGGLDQWLMLSFVAVLAAGGIAGAVVGLQQRMDGSAARVQRARWQWLHLLATWPLPVLLAFHVLKTYWY